MTLQEFKAWFDGFTENIEKLPSQKQWKRIQERVAEIDGVAVTERVYVDRWLQPYRPYWNWVGQAWPTSGYATNCSNTGIKMGSTVSSNVVTVSPFNSVGAMNDAGRAEAQSLEVG